MFLEKESVLLCVLLLWNVFSYEMKGKSLRLRVSVAFSY